MMKYIKILLLIFLTGCSTKSPTLSESICQNGDILNKYRKDKELLLEESSETGLVSFSKLKDISEKIEKENENLKSKIKIYKQENQNEDDFDFGKCKNIK